uniref:DUF2013 domain-containing protein n=1 Tax=Gongylonema pulchrum TaxID=637853 RepID=A0A183DYW6_9BILA
LALSIDSPASRSAEAERCVVEVMKMVCSLIYTSRREFTNLVECFLSDPSNTASTFSLIRTLLSELRGDELSQFYDFLSSSLLVTSPSLVLVSLIKIAPASLKDILLLLQRRDRGYQTLTGIDERDELLLSLALQGIVVHELFADLDNSFHICFLARYICEIIRLACAHRDEARRGNWLFRILHKILSLPLSELQEEESGGGATYAKFRSLITSVFASCRYEGVLLEETVKCIEEETIQAYAFHIAISALMKSSSES